MGRWFDAPITLSAYPLKPGAPEMDPAWISAVGPPMAWIGRKGGGWPELEGPLTAEVRVESLLIWVTRSCGLTLLGVSGMGGVPPGFAGAPRVTLRMKGCDCVSMTPAPGE